MKTSCLLASLLCCSGLYATDIPVRQFRHAGPIPLVSPLLADSVDMQGKAFAPEELLKTSVPFEQCLQKGQTLETSGNGELSLAAPAGNYALHILGFYLNSDRYTKGTLSISTGNSYQIFLDGKEIKPDTELTIEPKRYEVVIKYLADKKQENPSLKVTFKHDTQAVVTVSTNPEKRYTLADVMNGKDISGASLSPDGRFTLITFVNRFPGGENEYFGQLRTTDGKILAQNKDLAAAAWMPKSNLYYYTRKGLEGKELVCVNPDTGKENILAASLPEGSFLFSPDEKSLFFQIKEEGPKEDPEIIRVLEPADRLPGFRNRYFIWKYDLQTGLFQRLTFGHHTTSINDISSDGRYLLFSTSERVYTSLPFSRNSLYRLDLQTMQTDTIWENEKYANQALFSPDGKELLVFGSGETFNNIGLNIKKGQTANSYDGQLFIYRPENKTARPLTKDFAPNVTQAVWSKADGQIYLQAEDEDYVRLFRCNPENGEITRLDIPEDIVSHFALAEKAPVLLAYGQSVSNANRLYAYHTDTNKSAMMEDLSADKLENITLGEVHDWNFKSADGTTIQGRYYLPPHFDPNKKYPLIVNYYGGTSPTGRTLEGRYATHMYAAQGYVVYILNPSGTTGYGQEFAARHVNAWGTKTADEIIRGTELFCKEHSFVDKSKIGCIGASYGGFMTQYLQTKTDLFAAAISHAGISALSSYWGEGYWGYGYCAVANANTYPWNNPEFFTEHSPLFHADKINTPLLLLHGNADTNVPVGESIQMFAAMKILGKEVEFVQVDGQDHHILDYDKRVKWQNTIFAWFAKWLKGQPEWWDDLYPKRNL